MRKDVDGDFVFGKSLIFANDGVKVYTSVDQYQGDLLVGIYEKESSWLICLLSGRPTLKSFGLQPIQSNISLKMQLLV